MMVLPRIDPWYSSLTVGMRTARPVEALRSQSAVACQAMAALGDAWFSLRLSNASTLPALPSCPPYALQCSKRRPSVDFQSVAKRQVSCA